MLGCGSAPFDGATAERYGLVNRALPDADLDTFVDGLAAAIAASDHLAIAVAKAHIDRSTLPADADLVSDYEAFFASLARLTG